MEVGSGKRSAGRAEVNEIRDEFPIDQDEGGVKVRLIALGVVAVILGIFII